MIDRFTARASIPYRAFALLGACLALNTASIAADAKHVTRLPHSYSPQRGHVVVVDVLKDMWQVKLPGGGTQSLGEALEDGERGAAAPLLVADFNYDGYDDIAVLAGVGYGGAMTTYWLHLWEPTERKFKKFSSILGNPTLEPSRKAVITWERDGPQWTSTEYRVRNGVLSTAVVREQNALRWLNAPLDQLTIYPPDSGKVTDSRIVSAEAPTNVAPETLPSATAKIGDAKVWLHEQPNPAARTGMYLIKGDTVTLLDYRPSRDGDKTEYGWLFIRFEGKRKLEKWIPAGSIVN